MAFDNERKRIDELARLAVRNQVPMVVARQRRPHTGDMPLIYGLFQTEPDQSRLVHRTVKARKGSPPPLPVRFDLEAADFQAI